MRKNGSKIEFSAILGEKQKIKGEMKMFLKRETKDDCIIAGMLVGDMKEKEYDGKLFYEFGVGMGKDKDGNNLPIVNVAMWGRKIDLKKGDRAIACGKLKVTTKDEKTYYSMTADFVAKEGSEKRENPPQSELVEIESDDLPF